MEDDLNSWKSAKYWSACSCRQACVRRGLESERVLTNDITSNITFKQPSQRKKLMLIVATPFCLHQPKAVNAKDGRCKF